MPTYEEFRLPDAGEGLTDAEIVEWRVEVGQHVQVNDVLVEIETAKSLVELPSPYSGVVTALLVESGTTIDVGTPIVVIDTDPDGSDHPVAGSAETYVKPRGSKNGSPDSDGESLDTDQKQLRDAERNASRGADQSELRPAGQDDLRSADQEASRDVPDAARDAVLVGYGSAAQVPGRRRHHRKAPCPQEQNDADQGKRRADAMSVRAKPPVRKLAKDLGVDLTAVIPTGPGDIITREDVLKLIEGAQPRVLATYPADDQPWLASGTVSPDGRFTRVPVKSVRRRTAEAMVASAFTAPHVTVFQTLDITRTMKLVARLKEDREFAHVRVSPLLIVAKALLIAVNRHPEINASWDGEAQEIVYKHYVNLGIAAATPRGLVVPNIKDAHRLSLLRLAEEIAELTNVARAGKTSVAATTDGTVTITNVGVFGIDTGTPILNPGESAILAFGAIQQRPWIHKKKIKPRSVIELALSFDHRLVDGELGSRVLADVATVLNDPAHGLVWS